MFDFLFFDFDGTLVNNSLGIINSFKNVYAYFGIKVPSYEKLCTFIGPPLIETFKNEFGFDEEKSSQAVGIYRKYYAEKGLYENYVYEGISELLKNLKENKKHLVVASSKPEIFSTKILEHHNLAKYFDFICGSLPNESRSEKSEVILYALEKCKNPKLQNVLMIGDRKFDVEGAKKVGIKSCGVLYGFGKKEELEKSGADFICKNVEELNKICLE